MNQILKVILLIGLVVGFSTVAKQQDKKDKQESKIEVKCHVELFGGNETIYFRVLNSKHFGKLAKELVNREVLTSLSRTKQKIYKVHECVLLSDNFTLRKSQLIDNQMTR